MKARVKAVRYFEFKNKEQCLNLHVPDSLCQDLVSKVSIDDYFVKVISMSRDFSESEVFPIYVGGKPAGFLIPGQALLSNENDNNKDKHFAAYSLIAASHVCRMSFLGNYDLAASDCLSARNKDDVFVQGRAYGVFWKNRLPVHEHDFDDKYFVSLAQQGLYCSNRLALPRGTASYLPMPGERIVLKNNQAWPEHLRLIISDLFPYADNPFLRFFYIYQVIEHLMSNNFEHRFGEIKSAMDALTGISISRLKDLIGKFQGIVKEQPRINATLNPECPTTSACAEKILNNLGDDYSGMTFGEKIYRVRNTIFHDYPRTHGMDSDVEELAAHLYNYILTSKLV